MSGGPYLQTFTNVTS